MELVPAAGVSPATLSSLADGLRARLGADVAIAPELEIPDEWRARRGRIRSAAVVDALLAGAASAVDVGGAGDVLRLAVVDAELCGDDGARVFGEAAVGGGCAAVGIRALGRAKTDDSPRFLRRLITSAVHELAHAAGAVHCADPGCVMYPSAHIADTDRKGADLCDRCSADLIARNP